MKGVEGKLLKRCREHGRGCWISGHHGTSGERSNPGDCTGTKWQFDAGMIVPRQEEGKKKRMQQQPKQQLRCQVQHMLGIVMTEPEGSS